MMADNDQNNDEYKFAELDSLDNESMDDDVPGLRKPVTSQGQDSARKNVKRNALIAIGVIIFIMVMYKLIALMFLGKNNTESTQITAAPIAKVTPQPVQTEIITTAPPTPVVEQPQPIINTGDSDLKQKVSSIEVSQQSIRSEVTSVGEQVGTVNNNINNLNAQLTKLNQVIGNLSNQVTKQSEEISMLMARSQPKVVKPVNYHKIRAQRVIYYIQAVIPGRAWLIASNGSTLTVREGTKVAGYGMVKLIDAMQGRILTSSGQVIRFSQEDS